MLLSLEFKDLLIYINRSTQVISLIVSHTNDAAH